MKAYQFLFFLIYNVKYGLSSRCPCEEKQFRDSSSVPLLFCVNDLYYDRLSSALNDTISGSIQFKLLKVLHVHNNSDCDAIFTLKDDDVKSILCPQNCHPSLDIDLSSLFHRNEPIRNVQKTISCSYTIEMLLNQTQLSLKDLQQASMFFYNYSKSNTGGGVIVHSNMIPVSKCLDTIKTVMSAVYWRKMTECFENNHWQQRIPERYRPASTSRRKVYGLYLWIGSSSRRQLMLQQVSILNKVPNEGLKAIIGWGVDEVMFPCQAGTGDCLTARAGTGEFKPFMPATTLVNNSRGFDWACAQRRPLRALAHVLRLYNPTYLVIADDDTYINHELLEFVYSKTIVTDMVLKPIVLGHFIMKKRVSPSGFLFGGTGYVLGHSLLQRLAGTSIWESTGSDRYSNELSVLRELQSLCNTNESSPCFRTNSSQTSSTSSVRGSGRTTPVAVVDSGAGERPIASTTRLVDVCVELMAAEHNCYHSDYALTRCLLYGAQAQVKPLLCGPADYPKMCYYVSAKCDPYLHLTCHGWVPGANESSQPTLLPWRKAAINANK